MQLLKWSELDVGMIVSPATDLVVVYSRSDQVEKVVSLREIPKILTVIYSGSGGKTGNRKAVTFLGSDGPFWVGTGLDDSYDWKLRHDPYSVR
jgi:hypothetical protein